MGTRQPSERLNLDIKRTLLLFAPLLMAAFAGNELCAQQSITVNDMAQLRAAITTVNGTVTNDVITMNPGTYLLTNSSAPENANADGDLDILKAGGTLQINAAAAGVIIDGNSVDRILHINASGATISINGVTIRNGNATDDGVGATFATGGGILLWAGNVTLDSVTLENNSAVATAGSPGSAGSSGTAGGESLGGAIYVAGGTLNIVGSTLSSNSATGGDGGAGGTGNPDSGSSATGGSGGDGGQGGLGAGGAIYLAAGTVTISDSTLTANTASAGLGGDGGTGGSATAASASFATALGGGGGTGGLGGYSYGGAICVESGTMSINGSTIEQNSATTGAGGQGGSGGFALANAGGTASAVGGTGGVGGWAINATGGGIYVLVGSTVFVINSTVSSNAAVGEDGGDGGDGGGASATGSPPFSSNGAGGDGSTGGNAIGGGVAIDGGVLNIFNSTIADNTASAGLGGAGGTGATTGATGTDGSSIAGGVFRGGGTLTLDSSIVAGNDDNTASNDSEDLRGDATVGASLIQVDPVGSTITAGTGTNFFGVNPQLGALQNNGGATNTHSIPTGSPAENAGSNPQTLTTDQRGTGFARDVGGVDIGAFEIQPVTTTPPIITAPAVAVTVNAASYSVQGSSVANALVRVYTDLNNNGTVDGADAQVGSQQLTSGGTAFSVSVSLSQNTDNDFLVTADDGTNGESTYVDVPTITEDSTSPAGTTVTDPATAVSTTGVSYNVQGTAEAGSLVQVYRDYNDNGLIDGADAVVASGTATGGVFNINTSITQSTTNNFTVTATDAASNESSPVDVPTITEISAPAINPPVVTSPTGPVTVDAATFDIAGTAPADSLVRIYSDLNNDGFINGADAVVASLQLTSGATTFTIPTPLTQSATNDFLATADDSVNESLPVDVPTITEQASGGGGGGGDDSGCSTGGSQGTMWLLAVLAALVAPVIRRSRRRQVG